METKSILNLKGGVAKTTTGVNIAKGLANKGFKTLIIDTDMQANATSIFLEEERTKDDYKGFAELLVDEKLEDVEEYIYNVGENLDMIGSSLAVAESEMKIRSSFNRNSSNIVKKVLKKLDSKYDYCIIDCAPTINLITLNIIIASDEIIIPIKIDKFALEGYRTTLKNINQIVDDYELDTELTVLYTMVNRNNIDKQIIQNISGNRFETTIRHQAKPVTESALKNEVLIDSSKSSKVKEDYQKLIDEIIARG
ncbi:ParA family protein [Lactococcus lactis]|uniref:AAA family ATPase n=1 Tax=Lactococcus lactis TaxID=1358 RepID=A0AAP3Z2Z3_9LACT|nr:AAA family ATPase [Lactococcus lactis]MDG4969790.1 AAA family ATPase [Lactococcus lactis]MDG4977422.1 AAA family ATPase [Lactococcus lactis]MDG5103680.1 AAA family ATPase [Lactococcus lactis]TNU77514.1 chromosome partitioning protein ParA [Lactococcus lactis subsp. lactis]